MKKLAKILLIMMFCVCVSGLLIACSGEKNVCAHENTEIKNAVSATEESEGYSGDVYCTVCGVKTESGKSVPKLLHTHTLEKTDRLEPTCESDGNTEYFTCTKCAKLFSDEEAKDEIAAEDTVIEASHKYIDGVCEACGDSENGETPPETGGGDSGETPPETGGGDSGETPPETGGGDSGETPPETGGGDSGETPPETGDGDSGETPPETGDGDNGGESWEDQEGIIGKPIPLPIV